MPGEDIPPGRLVEFFARPAAVAHQRGMDELMLELSGNGRHAMIFPDQDPRDKRQREEEERRRHQVLAANFAPAAAGQGRPGEDKTPPPSTAPDITPA